MKCKTFTIRLADETRNFEEAKMNKFLEGVAVRQSFAEIVGGEYWSILVFYEDAGAVRAQTESYIEAPAQTRKPVAAIKSPETEPPAPEPIALTPEQENKFNALKLWRNERAGQDGLPPYMIAHNDSLMQIAASEIKTHEELINIKGFGEKRAQKYGDEILRILAE